VLRTEEPPEQLGQQLLVVRVARWTLEELKGLELQERHLVVLVVLQLFMVAEGEGEAVQELVRRPYPEVPVGRAFGEGAEGVEADKVLVEYRVWVERVYLVVTGLKVHPQV
jgi:hypothetical protein